MPLNTEQQSKIQRLRRLLDNTKLSAKDSYHPIVRQALSGLQRQRGVRVVTRISMPRLIVATQLAGPADRFAREIVRFWARFGGALAAAERQSVGWQPINTYACTTPKRMIRYKHRTICALHTTYPISYEDSDA
jgi:hypothetical protein